MTTYFVDTRQGACAECATLEEARRTAKLFREGHMTVVKIYELESSGSDAPFKEVH